MVHPKTVLTAFQLGEVRFIFARYRSGAPGLYELIDGTATSAREYVNTELWCPVPDCATPALTSVHRKKHRHHLRHFRGGKENDHKPESIFHIHGKAEFAKWARVALPSAVVVEEEASNAKRERVADVMITFDDGRRVAVEVQYASLVPSEWQERHESYQRQGIADVWLFGHHGKQLQAFPASGQVKLNPTHEDVAATGAPVFWFNPTKLEVGFVSTEVWVAGQLFRIFAKEGRGDFESAPISEFSLDAEGTFANERVRELTIAQVEYEKAVLALAEKMRMIAEHKEAIRRSVEEKWEAVRQAARDASRRAEEGAVVRTKLREFRYKRHLDAWPTSKDGKAVLEIFGGAVPPFLGVKVGVNLEIPEVAWQSHLYLTEIHHAEAGANVDIYPLGAETIREFATDTDVYLMDRAIQGWFQKLVSAGVLGKRPPRGGWSPTFTQHFKPAEAGRGDVENDVLGLFDLTPEEKLAAFQNDERTQASLNWMMQTACLGCGKPLSVRTPDSYHITCSPGWRRSSRR